MAETNYQPVYPADVHIDDRVKALISEFYSISDDPSRNEEWVDCFAPDAVLVMGDRSARGTEEIRELRRGMWEKIRTRRHRPEKVFPAAYEGEGGSEGTGRWEYMLHGTLDLVMREDAGKRQVVTWAGRAVLEEDDGGRLSFLYYQVWLHNQLG
ncbi:hypothetical protein F4778DRAFT_171372 [Xylariomycetidae sp. FL2044]|nr:hypothetical protein F4778DRAFT_171372 [Xylariomycetidae sp. FL2044]